MMWYIQNSQDDVVHFGWLADGMIWLVGGFGGMIWLVGGFVGMIWLVGAAVFLLPI